jgi:zinc finger RNA-binding protein
VQNVQQPSSVADADFYYATQLDLAPYVGSSIPIETRRGNSDERGAGASGSNIRSVQAVWQSGSGGKPYSGAAERVTGLNSTGDFRRPGDVTTGPSWQKKQFYSSNPRMPRQAPKPSQLFYCEVCKISCAGEQTYTEHLQGKNHKKKETLAATLAKKTTPILAQRSPFFCELCDVSCTCGDTYAAHVRGVKHQKVLSLHQKLGKPIPDSTKSGKPGDASSDAAKAVKVVAPRMSFVGGTVLRTTDSGMSEEAPVEEAGAGMVNDSTGDSYCENNQPVGKRILLISHCRISISATCHMCIFIA